MFDRCRLMAWLIAIAAVGLPIAAHAEVKLAQVFAPHAVLQRDKPFPVWGWAEPDEKIAVTLGVQQAETVTNKDGKWSVKLAAQAMSTAPLTLKVVGKNTVEVPDVLLGDVWFCSGQSNMEFSLRECDAEADIRAADFPTIRVLKRRLARMALPHLIDARSARGGGTHAQGAVLGVGRRRRIWGRSERLGLVVRPAWPCFRPR